MHTQAALEQLAAGEQLLYEAVLARVQRMLAALGSERGSREGGAVQSGNSGGASGHEANGGGEIEGEGGVRRQLRAAAAGQADAAVAQQM